MDTPSLCWVCSLPLSKGDRTIRPASLGFDVHARCADTLMREEPPPDDDVEDIPA